MEGFISNQTRPFSKYLLGGLFSLLLGGFAPPPIPHIFEVPARQMITPCPQPGNRACPVAPLLRINWNTAIEVPNWAQLGVAGNWAMGGL